MEALKQRLKGNPKGADSEILLAAAGQDMEARQTIDMFLKQRPRYTINVYADGEFYRNPRDLQRILAALRKAGLPE